MPRCYSVPLVVLLTICLFPAANHAAPADNGNPTAIADSLVLAQAGPGTADTSQPPPATPRSGGEGFRLPFQGTGTAAPPGPVVPPTAPQVAPEAAGKDSIEVTTPGRGRASGSPGAPGSAAAKPKPKRPDRGAPTAQRSDSESQRKGSAVKPTGTPSAAGAAGQKPRRQPSPSGTASADASEAGTVKSLPPLPPALPYVPPGGRATVTPGVAPGTDGTIMARVPRSGPPFPGRIGRPPEAQSDSSETLPQAQQLTSTNPISGFILDSFPSERPRPLEPPAGATGPAPQRPSPREKGAASTIFGQLANDVRELGQGIKGAVGQLLPGQ